MHAKIQSGSREEDSDGWRWNGEIFPFQLELVVVVSNKLWVTAAAAK